MVMVSNTSIPSTRASSLSTIAHCNHHQPSILFSRACSTAHNDNDNTSTHSDHSSRTSIDIPPPITPRSPFRPPNPTSRSQTPNLPSTQRSRSFFPPLPHHPYHSFVSYSWYRDHLSLQICQLIMLGIFILSIQDLAINVLGVSALLRSRVFLIWIFAMVPFSSLLHLAFWYLGATVLLHYPRLNDWLHGRGRFSYMGERKQWILRITAGEWVFWVIRFLLKGGLMVLTFSLARGWRARNL
ncbi:hypothetical protein CC80DRAFT_599554 [Byssothecium circinans]|uniref:Uncharacterized protein n=1 Tax=Byssothecium circinans TaxID=147558 RepID=A0A6A5T8B5_9PLEO|nr:hypothetical protein CC80DRAFT_314932 [Byssothecium circinans]KAF1948614.1 hypothetical protein CC80DRAFT_599554 [Byssothecium circinans]